MTDRMLSATRSLVNRFRRQRPVRSGSLIITMLGDAIAPRGGAVTLGSLIRLAQPFGITERLVRTSVGRLAQDGWLESQRTGRQSEYRLTDRGRHRFAEATQRIYADSPQSWDRTWTLLLLPESPRARRERIRDEMGWLGFGQISAGVLAHPSRTLDDTRAQLTELGEATGVVLMRASSEELPFDRELVKAGWDLADLSRRYARFVSGFAAIRTALAAGGEPSPENAFIVRTLLIHEYRKIHLRDPLLPVDLLPENWIGTAAYDLCRDLYRRLFAAAESHVASLAETLDGKLTAPSQDTLRRFGGLYADG
jgi:phenylacetic acid degradation operon negative regulatory protein